jgi:hypothetical protein
MVNSLYYGVWYPIREENAYIVWQVAMFSITSYLFAGRYKRTLLWILDQPGIKLVIDPLYAIAQLFSDLHMNFK